MPTTCAHASYLLLCLVALAALLAPPGRASSLSYFEYEEYEAAASALDTSTVDAPDRVSLVAPGGPSGDTYDPAVVPDYRSSAAWPPFVPTDNVYFDTQCFGKSEPQCRKAGRSKSKAFCKWYTFNGPHCYDSRFLSVGPAPNQRDNHIPVSTKFFAFNFGVHLVEGTFTRTFYNALVDECAMLCLNATSGFGDELGTPRIHCLSFDFYPFEVPRPEAPYFESEEAGVCVLNSETKDTARLRNEDQGFTDAELFYKSHHTTRPFSPLDGYYEVRDPRGGYISTMLEYTGPQDRKTLGLQTAWGGSRWGIFHPGDLGYLPTVLTPSLVCNGTVKSDPPPPPTYRGGFTPITSDQHCPGPITKAAATALCQVEGASLCTDAVELAKLTGRKLGCAYDTDAHNQIWHQAMPDNGQLAYPRCCVTYTRPFDPAADSACSAYEPANMQRCALLRSATDCIASGSGASRRFQMGFGVYLDQLRGYCKNSGRASCFMFNIAQWTSLTKCVWCPLPGPLPGGGNGQCRPGGSYGICSGADVGQKATFGVQARAVCSDLTNCNLLAAFPDVAPYLFPDGTPPGALVSGADSAPAATPLDSAHPSAVPTASPPTDFPAPPPTDLPTSALTMRPSAKATLQPTVQRPAGTSAPTVRRTAKPTVRRTAKPTASVVQTPPPTRPVTGSPSANPTQQPTGAATAGLPPGVTCTSYRLVANCAANFPWCKWDAIHGVCLVNPDPSVMPVLPCSYEPDKWTCGNRALADACVWYVNTKTGTGQCIRSVENRRGTSSPTVP